MNKSIGKRVYLKNYLTKLPYNTVRVARGSRWGNPYPVSKYGRDEAINKYRIWITQKLIDNPKFLNPLIGKDLACYCKIGNPCHVDVLLEKIQEIGGTDDD